MTERNLSFDLHKDIIQIFNEVVDEYENRHVGSNVKNRSIILMSMILKSDLISEANVQYKKMFYEILKPMMELIVIPKIDDSIHNKNNENEDENDLLSLILEHKLKDVNDNDDDIRFLEEELSPIPGETDPDWEDIVSAALNNFALTEEVLDNEKPRSLFANRIMAYMNLVGHDKKDINDLFIYLTNITSDKLSERIAIATQNFRKRLDKEKETVNE